jgi:hypothetical protein
MNRLEEGKNEFDVQALTKDTSFFYNEKIKITSALRILYLTNMILISFSIIGAGSVYYKIDNVFVFLVINSILIAAGICFSIAFFMTTWWYFFEDYNFLTL